MKCLGNLLACNSLHHAATFSRCSCQSDHTRRFNDVIGIVAQTTWRYFRPGWIRRNPDIENIMVKLKNLVCLITQYNMILQYTQLCTVTCRYYTFPRLPIDFVHSLKKKTEKRMLKSCMLSLFSCDGIFYFYLLYAARVYLFRYRVPYREKNKCKYLNSFITLYVALF